jgi:hypothetical protein
MVDDNIDDTVEQQSAVEQMDSPPSTKKNIGLLLKYCQDGCRVSKKKK